MLHRNALMNQTKCSEIHYVRFNCAFQSCPYAMNCEQTAENSWWYGTWLKQLRFVLLPGGDTVVDVGGSVGVLVGADVGGSVVCFVGALVGVSVSVGSVGSVSNASVCSSVASNDSNESSSLSIKNAWLAHFCCAILLKSWANFGKLGFFEIVAMYEKTSAYEYAPSLILQLS